MKLKEHKLIGKIITVVSCLVILVCLVSMSRFNISCDNIRGDVLRLHILANSDSDDDQQLKLCVRDRILEETGDLFLSAVTYEEAVAITDSLLPEIISIAEDEIEKQGYSYDVKAQLGYTFFDTRHYDEYTLPAGNYLALNVTIGEGKGHNWWCVMFPSICLSSSVALDDKLDSDEIEVITDYSGYKVEFKLVEWYEKILSKVKAGD